MDTESHAEEEYCDSCGVRNPRDSLTGHCSLGAKCEFGLGRFDHEKAYYYTDLLAEQLQSAVLDEFGDTMPPAISKAAKVAMEAMLDLHYEAALECERRES